MKAQVRTETEVVPSRTTTQVDTQKQPVIEQNRLVERNKTEAPASTTSTGGAQGVVETKPAAQPAP